MLDQEIVITVVRRLVLSLNAGRERTTVGAKVWENTLFVLPKAHEGREYRNIITDCRLTVHPDRPNAALRVGDVLADFPVALLELRASQQPIVDFPTPRN